MVLETIQFKYQVKVWILYLFFVLFQTFLLFSIIRYFFFTNDSFSVSMRRLIRLEGEAEFDLIQGGLALSGLSVLFLVLLIKNYMSPGVILIGDDEMKLSRWKLFNPVFTIQLNEISDVVECVVHNKRHLEIKLEGKTYRIYQNLFESNMAYYKFKKLLFDRVEISGLEEEIE